MPIPAPATLAVLAVFALIAAVAAPAAAQEDAAAPAKAAQEGPHYSLAADAAAGMILAADGLYPASADSAAVWTVQANFLHRLEAPGWGMVLSHNVDISGQAATAAAPSFSPTTTVYEAYARLDIGEWTQLFVGKRRMGLGIGSTFAPGDALDPRSGFWDQKTGFRGIDLAASIGPDISLRAALSLDRSFDAYAAGMEKKTAASAFATAPSDAAAQAAAGQAAAAYAAALDGAAGPADPRLFTYALSAEAQLGSVQAAVAGVYARGDADSVERPSIGVSVDLSGLILQAEGAAELSGAPDWYASAGARYTWSNGPSMLSLSADYDYNGRAGLLKNAHYLLPYASYTLDQVFNLYARALVELEAPSALLSLGLTLYPAEGFDLELTGLFGLGGPGAEFSSIQSFAVLPSPGTGVLSSAIGFAARVHF